MTTAEDVFWIYERNSTHYYNCVKQGKIETCTTKWNNNCYCVNTQIVKPITIGEQDTDCDLKRKTYIIIGDECPICIEPIMHKIDAYLTPCGHGFHKKCLFNAFKTKWKTKYCSQFYCPMCRSRLGQIVIESRYKISNNNNGLDDLENFWINKDYRYCNPCMKNYKHYEGMDNNCDNCLNYRKTGLSFFYTLGNVKWNKLI